MIAFKQLLRFRKAFYVLIGSVLLAFGSQAFASVPAQQVYQYAKNLDYTSLRYLGSSIDNEDSSGNTALCIALEKNDRKAYQTLLQYGANRNARCVSRRALALKRMALANQGSGTFLGMGTTGWIVTAALVAGGVGIAVASGGGSHSSSSKSDQPAPCAGYQEVCPTGYHTTSDTCTVGEKTFYKCEADTCDGYVVSCPNGYHPSGEMCRSGDSILHKCVLNTCPGYVESCPVGYEETGQTCSVGDRLLKQCRAQKCLGFDFESVPQHCADSSYCLSGKETKYRCNACEKGWTTEDCSKPVICPFSTLECIEYDGWIPTGQVCQSGDIEYVECEAKNCTGYDISEEEKDSSHCAIFDRCKSGNNAPTYKCLACEEGYDFNSEGVCEQISTLCRSLGYSLTACNLETHYVSEFCPSNQPDMSGIDPEEQNQWLAENYDKYYHKCAPRRNRDNCTSFKTTADVCLSCEEGWTGPTCEDVEECEGYSIDECDTAEGWVEEDRCKKGKSYTYKCKAAECEADFKQVCDDNEYQTDEICPSGGEKLHRCKPRQHSDNCVELDPKNDKCLRCDDNYVLNESGYCITFDAQCIELGYKSEACENGQYIDPDDKCPTNPEYHKCLRRTNTAHCTEFEPEDDICTACEDGFGILNGKCVSNSALCANENPNYTAVECNIQDQYISSKCQFDNRYHICTVRENRDYCTLFEEEADRCTACSRGNILDEQTGKCVPETTECEEEFSPSNVCDAATQYAELCEANASYRKCHDRGHLVENCIAYQNETEDDGICKTCAEDYNLKNNACVLIDKCEGYSPTVTCTGDTYKSACTDNTSLFKCEERTIKVANCTAYLHEDQNDGICKSCEDGYTTSPDGRTCVEDSGGDDCDESLKPQHCEGEPQCVEGSWTCSACEVNWASVDGVCNVCTGTLNEFNECVKVTEECPYTSSANAIENGCKSGMTEQCSGKAWKCNGCQDDFMSSCNRDIGWEKDESLSDRRCIVNGQSLIHCLAYPCDSKYSKQECGTDESPTDEGCWSGGVLWFECQSDEELPECGATPSDEDKCVQGTKCLKPNGEVGYDCSLCKSEYQDTCDTPNGWDQDTGDICYADGNPLYKCKAHDCGEGYTSQTCTTGQYQIGDVCKSGGNDMYKCGACIAHCKQCNNGTTCELCSPEYTGNTCSECADGYHHEGTECVPDSEAADNINPADSTITHNNAQHTDMLCLDGMEATNNIIAENLGTIDLSYEQTTVVTTPEHAMHATENAKITNSGTIRMHHLSPYESSNLGIIGLYSESQTSTAANKGQISLTYNQGEISGMRGYNLTNGTDTDASAKITLENNTTSTAYGMYANSGSNGNRNVVQNNGKIVLNQNSLSSGMESARNTYVSLINNSTGSIEMSGNSGITHGISGRWAENYGTIKLSSNTAQTTGMYQTETSTATDRLINFGTIQVDQTSSSAIGMMSSYRPIYNGQEQAVGGNVNPEIKLSGNKKQAAGMLGVDVINGVGASITVENSVITNEANTGVYGIRQESQTSNRGTATNLGTITIRNNYTQENELGRGPSYGIYNQQDSKSQYNGNIDGVAAVINMSGNGGDTRGMYGYNLTNGKNAEINLDGNGTLAHIGDSNTYAYYVDGMFATNSTATNLGKITVKNSHTQATGMNGSSATLYNGNGNIPATIEMSGNTESTYGMLGVSLQNYDDSSITLTNNRNNSTLSSTAGMFAQNKTSGNNVEGEEYGFAENKGSLTLTGNQNAFGIYGENQTKIHNLGEITVNQNTGNAYGMRSDGFLSNGRHVADDFPNATDDEDEQWNKSTFINMSGNSGVTIGMSGLNMYNRKGATITMIDNASSVNFEAGEIGTFAMLANVEDVPSETANISNAGTINITQTTGATYAMAATGDGNYTLENKGSINVQSVVGYGIYAANGSAATSNNVRVINSGSINIVAQDPVVVGGYNVTGAIGIFAGGNIKVTNTGTITVNKDTTGGVGIYATGDVTVSNTGNININGRICTGDDCFNQQAYPNAIVLADGATKYEVQSLMRSMSLDTTSASGTLVASKTARFAIENEFEGDLVMSSDVVTDGFEDTYTVENMINAGDVSNLNLHSQSALFEAELQNESDAVLTMKSFDEVIQNQSVAEFLKQNYDAGNNEELFNLLKEKDSLVSLNDAVNALTADDVFNRFNFEDMTIMRELNADVNNRLFNSTERHLTTAGNVAPFYFESGMGSNARYALYNTRIGNKSVGLSLALSNVSSSDRHDNNTRRDETFQMSVPFGYNRCGFKFITAPRFGYAYGTYDRNGYAQTYDGKIEKRMMGLMNEARYPIRMSGWSLSPAAEFNMLGYHVKGHEENAPFALNIKSQNNYSVEAGLGLYANKNITLGTNHRLQMQAGVAAYHEFADPYTTELEMQGMSGSFKIRDERRKDNRTVLRAGFDYNFGEDFSLSGAIATYIDGTTHTNGNLDFKYHF